MVLKKKKYHSYAMYDTQLFESLIRHGVTVDVLIIAEVIKILSYTYLQKKVCIKKFPNNITFAYAGLSICYIKVLGSNNVVIIIMGLSPQFIIK